MKYLIPLLLLFLTAPAAAQTPVEILDSIYNIKPPYKKMIKQMGGVANISVSVLRLSERDNGEDLEFCRIGITDAPIVSPTTYSILRGSERHYVLLTRSEAQKLVDMLEAMFISSGKSHSGFYVEYVDEITSGFDRLTVSIYSGENEKAWRLLLDANKYGDRGRARIRREQTPGLAKAIKDCIAILK